MGACRQRRNGATLRAAGRLLSASLTFSKSHVRDVRVCDMRVCDMRVLDMRVRDMRVREASIGCVLAGVESARIRSRHDG